jgi:Tfp pilus assembly protein PilX
MIRRRHNSAWCGEISCGISNRGSALIIALICLVLVSALTATLVQIVILQRSQVERDEWQLQAEWLAESGVDRAAARLAADGAYTGEEWLPQPPGAPAPLGRVRIAIDRSSGTNEPHVTVVADVPHDADERARVRKNVVLPTIQPTAGEP